MLNHYLLRFLKIKQKTKIMPFNVNKQIINFENMDEGLKSLILKIWRLMNKCLNFKIEELKLLIIKIKT